MKKITTTLLFLIILINVRAQMGSILGLTVTPTNPTTTDTVKVIASVMFTSGGCNLQNSNVSINGSIVNVEACHDVGPLTVICYSTDTISLGVISQPGSYSLNYYLGALDWMTDPTNCGSFDKDTAATTFTIVSTPAGIAENSTDFLVYPNPAQSKVCIKHAPVGTDSYFIIYSMFGKEERRVLLQANSIENTIDLSQLTPGLYLYKIETPGFSTAIKKLTIKE